MRDGRAGIIAVAVLACGVLSCDSSSSAPAQKWEYATFRNHAGEGQTAVYSYQSPTQAVSGTWSEVATAIGITGSSGERGRELEVMNRLGSQGWELTDARQADTGSILTFKRRAS